MPGKARLKIAVLKSHPDHPGANELNSAVYLAFSLANKEAEPSLAKYRNVPNRSALR